MASAICSHDTLTAHADTQPLASSPSSTTSGCLSGDESYTEEKESIPPSLVEDELQLALNKVTITK